MQSSTINKADKATEAADRRAELRGSIDQAIDTLGAELEKGGSEALRQYLDFSARFHHYSINNLFLIYGQRPSATRVAGFNTWRNMGRQVRKGEKGIAIFAPMTVRPKGADGAPDPDKAPVTLFRVVYVFDVAQTDGFALPEPPSASGDPGAALDALARATTERGITLEWVEPGALGPGVAGASSGGRVRVTLADNAAERFATLAHELAHELLAHKGAGLDKRTREVEAEGVAYVVGARFGIAVPSADYLTSYGGDREALAASLERIRECASGLITQVERILAGEESAPGASALATRDAGIAARALAA